MGNVLQMDADGLLRGVALTGGGAVLGHLWTRFRNRLSVLSWTSQTAQIAASVATERYGRVEVLYNGQPVHRLYVGSVELRNESNSDLHDLRVVVAARDGSHILLSNAGLVGSLHGPYLPEAFFEQWDGALKTGDAAGLEYFQSTRDYLVPVLNRGGIVEFEVLLSRDDHEQPSLTLSCSHVGVALKNRPPVPQVLGVNQLHAIIVGLAATIAMTAFAVLSGVPVWAVGLMAALSGWMSQVLGAFLVTGLRAVVRALS